MRFDWCKANLNTSCEEHKYDHCEMCNIARAYQHGYEIAQDDMPKTGWIPVSERLPSEKKAVLICDSRGNRFVGELVLTDYGYKWSAPLFGVWIDIEDGDAWMPLPKPFGERSEDE